MSNVHERLLKFANEQKQAKKGKSKGRAGAALAHSLSGAGGTSSPGQVISSSAQGTPAKRQRQGEDLVDLTAVAEEIRLEQRFVVPNCYGARNYFELNPPIVPGAEKAMISTMDAEKRREQLARDAAAMMRMWETALVLNEEKGCSAADLEKSRARNAKLEGLLAKAEIELEDHRGKYQVFVEQVKELRETKEELGKLREQMEALRVKSAAEAEEIARLKAAMAPADDEPEDTRGLETRAQLVAEAVALKQAMFDSASYAWGNAVAQLKVLNPTLVEEGIGMLKKVEGGEIVIPEAYREMEEEENEEDDGGEQQDESNHGEDGA